MPNSPGSVIIEEDEGNGGPSPTGEPSVANGGVKQDGGEPDPQPNGSALVPAPVAPMDVETPGSKGSPQSHEPSRSPGRDGALLSRFRQWTSSFRSSSLKSVDALPPSGAAPNGDPAAKSPRLGARKVSQSLSKLFNRSCSRSASRDLEPAAPSASATNSPEPVHHAMSRRLSSSARDVSAPPQAAN